MPQVIKGSAHGIQRLIVRHESTFIKKSGIVTERDN
jgi:hypothetical protein